MVDGRRQRTILDSRLRESVSCPQVSRNSLDQTLSEHQQCNAMHSGVIARTCTRFSSIHIQRPFSSPGCAAQFQWASNCCKQFSLIFVILGDSRAVSSHASSEDERCTGPIESTPSPTPPASMQMTLPQTQTQLPKAMSPTTIRTP